MSKKSKNRGAVSRIIDDVFRLSDEQLLNKLKRI